ncbi:MAG: phage baseplate assembly protein V [Planctomycetota bacterium]|nr:phage baseplate assembly protein V [Planctomycetota bacterium]
MQRLSRSAPRVFGVTTAIVTHNSDPDAKGRVRLRYPWLGEENESGWARVVVPYAGDGRGCYVVPEIGDAVIVAFEGGDPDRPVVVGSVWSGRDVLPCEPDDRNSIKCFRSKSGMQVIWDDREGAEKILIQDREALRSIEIDMGGGKIRIAAEDGDVEIAAPDGRVAISCRDLSIICKGEAVVESDSGISLATKGNLSIRSRRNVDVKSQGSLILSGRNLEARGAASMSLRGGRVDLKADSVLKEQAPLVQIN